MSDTFSADTVAKGGAVTAAGAGVTIVALTGLYSDTSQGATYRVVVNVDMSGTIDTGNIANLKLQSGGVDLVNPLPSVAGMFPVVLDRVTLKPGASDLTLVAIGAFAANSIVAATIAATRVG